MRVVIAEDEALLREGLQLLTARAGYQVVATVGDAESLVAAAREHAATLVLTDIRMPPTNTDAPGHQRDGPFTARQSRIRP